LYRFSSQSGVSKIKKTGYARIIILSLSLSNQAACVQKNIVTSIKTTIYEQILKLLLIQPKDIIKECVKITLPMIVFLKNWPINSYCIDYGFEALWAGYHEDIGAIPGTLIKYACTDFCYQQLYTCGQLYKFDYPSKLKEHAFLYSIARVSTPLFIKHWIRQIIDTILNQFLKNDEQEYDQMIETNDDNIF
jgi:hypothetical protein